MFNDHHCHHHCHDNEPGIFSMGCGCLMGFVLIIGAIGIALGLAAALFSLVWIPGIIATLYFALTKDTDGKKKIKVILCVVFSVLSFIWFLFILLDDSVHSVEANWPEDTFDISETTEVELIISPEDATVESVELKDNDIAQLEYKDGRAFITFKQTGSEYLYFIVNDDKRSEGTYITVKDQNSQTPDTRPEDNGQAPKGQPQENPAQDGQTQESQAQDEPASPSSAQ